MRRLRDLVADRESWLVRSVIAYARERGYTKYTSTLEEAWRASIAGLSAPLIELLNGSAAPLELSPDDDFSSDPLSAFGVLEARRHRERGVPLPMFLGLMKYYRQSYVDLVREAGFPREDEEAYRRIVERFFDRVEVAFVTEWDRSSGESRLAELSAVNRTMTNEKNKYLTLFESLPTPAFLLDREGRIENANHAAAELLGPGATPGGLYYAAERKAESLPFLSEEVSAFLSAGVPSRGIEKMVGTPKGFRHYRVAMHRMLDVSGKFEGAVVILSDLTKWREAEETLQVVLEEMESRIEERTEDLAGLNRALQLEIGTRRRAEAALAAQRKVLQDVVDSVPALIFIKDRENRLLLVNRALAELRGVSPEEMAGKPASDFFPEEQAQRFFEDDRAVIASGEPRLGILEQMDTVGGVRWYLKHKVPQRDAAGEIVGVIGIAMDITDFQQE